MRNPQLKESLLGWGGYQDLQDKIYLDKEVVYMSKYDTINQYSSYSYTRGTYYEWTRLPSRNWNVWTESPTPKVGDWVMYGNTGAWGYVQSVNTTENKITVVQGTSSYIYEYEFVREVENMNGTYGFSKNKIYSVNIDGEQNDKAVELRIYGYDNTKYNERFFFDKRTQCLVRTAYESFAPVSTYPSNENYVWKHMVFESYDPNTLERLDNHQVWGYSSQDFNNECRKENVYQGLYSFYCNGLIAPEDGQTTGRMHPATVFVYSPRHKKVFSVEVGNHINIENSANTPVDYYEGIYNNSENLDKLNDLTIGLYAPHYNSGSKDQKFYEIKVNLETNPVSCFPKSKLNLSTIGTPYTNNNYIASNLNSNNCFVTDVLDTTYSKQFDIKLTAEINSAFINDNNAEVILMEPTSTNAGAVIKLYHDNGQIKLGRFCRNIEGDLVSDSSFILSGVATIQANTKYDIYWSFDGTTESLKKTDDEGILRIIAFRSTNVITDFICFPTSYKIGPEYTKLYLAKCNIDFTWITNIGETHDTITTDANIRGMIISEDSTKYRYVGSRRIMNEGNPTDYVKMLYTDWVDRDETTLTWTEGDTVEVSQNALQLYVMSETCVACLTGDGHLYKTTNATSWTTLIDINTKIGTTIDVWDTLVYGNGTYLAVGHNNSDPTTFLFYTSPDLITWTYKTSIEMSESIVDGRDPYLTNNSFYYNGEFNIVLTSYDRSEHIYHVLVWVSSDCIEWRYYLCTYGGNSQFSGQPGPIYIDYYHDQIFSVYSGNIYTGARSESSYYPNPSNPYYAGLYAFTNSGTSFPVSIPYSTSVRYPGDKMGFGMLKLNYYPKKSSSIEITQPARLITGGGSYRDVAYGDDKFVVVPYSGADPVYYSENGETWSAGNAIGSTAINVAYGNGKFLKYMSNTQLAASTDGITWGASYDSGLRYPIGSTTYYSATLDFVNDRFVLFNSAGYISYSSDGTNWSSLVQILENKSWKAIAYYKGKYYMGGGSTSSSSPNYGSWLATSTDFTTWGTPVNISNWQSVGFLPYMFYYNPLTDKLCAFANAINDDAANPYISETTDGITWTNPEKLINLITSVEINGIANSDNEVVFTNIGGTVMILRESSTDTTSTINTNIADPDPFILNERSTGEGILHTDDLYQCLPFSYGSCLFSTHLNNQDTINKYVQFGTTADLNYGKMRWKNIIEATERTWMDAAYFQGKYYLIGPTGTLKYSTDLINWTTESSSPSMSDIVSIAAKGDDLLVVLNTSGYVSTWNGSGSWSSPVQIASLSHPAFMGIRYNGSKFMAYSSYGTSSGSTWTYETYSVTSEDGITWTANDISSDVGGCLMGDLFNGQFMVYHNQGSYFTSSDGITWTEHTLNSPSGNAGIFPVQNSLFSFYSPSYYSRSNDYGETWTEWAPSDISFSRFRYASFYHNGHLFLFGNPSSGNNYNTFISDYLPLTEEVIRVYSNKHTYNGFTDPDRFYTYSCVMPAYNNMLPRSTASIYIPVLNDNYEWKGSEMIFSSLLRKNWDGVLESGFLRVNFIDPLLSNGVTITNQPRSLCGPKYIQRSTKISGIQELGTIDGTTFTKTNSGEAYAALFATSSEIVNTLNNKMFSFVLVSEDPNAVIISSSGTDNYMHESFIYNGTRYYVGMNSIYHDLSVDDPVITTDLAINVFLSAQNIYSSMDSIQSEIWSLALYTLGKLPNNESYIEPVLIKDYYSGGQNKLTYKYFYSGTDTTYTVQLYDAVTKAPYYILTNELSVVPSTDKHMILTSTDIDGLCRYLNLVSLELNNKYLIVPHTDIIDCNRNTVYLNDNQTSSGVFSIKPVAIADGDLKPEDEEIPETLYAWKRVSNNITTYVFTDSLDAPLVVGKTFYYKDSTNHFYREAANPYTTISSLQSNYITTQNGLEYARDDAYDWALNHSTNEYTPFNMRGWRA